jgi:glycosyltransferase involved in cell wall biosynthesis
MERVSIIIPTFNRFSFLLNTIRSIKLQTYDNIEIIVVNDCSTENEYYEYKWKDNEINIIHLETNSKNIFGFACAAYVRNKGIEISSGKYIAFCDDDDIWFPSKIELQLNAMKKTGCKMSSTDGLIGNGVYDSNTVYKKYNAEHYFNTLKNIYKEKNSNFLDKSLDINFIQININIYNIVLQEENK